MKTLVVADDITGANDIGVMYAKSGLKTITYTCGSSGFFECGEAVCVVDTDSRFLTAKQAYDRVYRAVKAAPDCDRYFDKQCSVFRGNIGAEFDAMLDALGEEFAAVVLGYPANGRTTVNSIHYVHGVRLEDSQFRSDPVHPMHLSDLRQILGQQTRRRVGAITVADLDAGEEFLRKRVAQLRQQVNYLIFDVRSAEDLARIAAVIRDVRVVCGSAEIAYYLGLEECRSRCEPVLAIAGSLTPQTIAQVEYMRQKGYSVLELDTIAIAQGHGREMAQALEAQAGQRYIAGDFLLIHTTQEAALVGRTKELAAQRGLSNVEISSLISQTLAEVTERLCRKYRIRKCIVLGGDTSAAFCRSMEIQAMEIFEEIESGVPLLRKPNSNQYFVLKSGSFGTDAFIERADQKLLSR